MKQPKLPLGVAAILAVAISAAAGAGVIASGQRIELALALVAFLLAGSHLAIFLYRDLLYRQKFSGLNEIHLRGRKLADELTNLTVRMDALEGGRHEEAQPQVPDPGDLNREFEELRRSVKKLAEDYGQASAAPEGRREPELSRTFAHPERPESPAAEHRLEFFLEPIVSLAEDVTLHYRASLVLEGNGQRVAFEELARQAADNGLRPDLDGHAVSRALVVGTKLAAKRPGTCVFVPIGAETLASDSALATIEWQMGKAGKAAAIVIFEIDHATMAALSPRGIEGMARLARNGAGMALARAHGMGIDPAALRDLQFRFISFSAAALPTAGRSPPVWADTARLARSYGLTIGLQGLFYDEQVRVASRWASLGSGPAFAPPRRVKGEAVPVNQLRTAA